MIRIAPTTASEKMEDWNKAPLPPTSEYAFLSLLERAPGGLLANWPMRLP
jgi:hypothetical protein